LSFTAAKVIDANHLGHHSVAITERTYAQLMPTAFAGDCGRIRFRMPSEAPLPVATLQAVQYRARR
jgi:hypothetical protein